MTLLLRGAFCASLLALVAGCCANSTNTCDDLYADSLYFKLKAKPDNSTDKSYFSAAELDTVYLQRYTPAHPATQPNGITPGTPAAPATYSDPVSIIRAKQNISLNSGLRAHLRQAGFSDADTLLIISNNSPFSPSTTGGKLSAYHYLLTVQNKPVRPGQTYQFDLDSIQLKGQYNANSCTTCYQNTFKYFDINKGKAKGEVTEKDGKPIATLLSKNEANSK
ncbi:hypothetical protein GCM10023172_31730 [Hymenobacter ginsengisoli]|uniref:Lipoprotein n=1 Tax=Hymenobacter ginsengisoli TaxID=1051626 RepID=A0ABP8QQ27_9BACT|nr:MULTISPECIES: hypothetical protein [unclassified Hymenobacter]MBO2031289.1 hypothetical protein [Hymenobacter sp. BT559]